MKLYDYQLAPNPRRVRIFLAEKGITILSRRQFAKYPRCSPEGSQKRATLGLCGNLVCYWSSSRHPLSISFVDCAVLAGRGNGQIPIVGCSFRWLRKKLIQPGH